jgi:hypothetical protein
MFGTSRARFGGLAPATLVIVIAACAGGDGDDRGNGGSLAELRGHLAAAGDLGVRQQREFEWDNATDLLVQGLVIPEATRPSELAAAIEDAGFQGAVGRELGNSRHRMNVRIGVVQFDSAEGAREARDLLHEQDLKQPCSSACIVSPREYELAEIPDSAAAHHVPVRGKLPPGRIRFEAHHAEFVIGSQLYVVQADGRPSTTFGAEFDRIMRSVYEAAAGAHDSAGS